MKKINLYGGPNCGKSTIAAAVFVELKARLINCELVREFAKELVYKGIDMRSLDEGSRLGLLAEQLHRENILKGKVEYLVTDSPMLLTAYYHNKDYAKIIAIDNLDKDEFHFWLPRTTLTYEQNGRSHTLEESLGIDKEMKEYLLSSGITLIEVDGSIKERTEKIVSVLLSS
jgi:hypothetical protein